MLAKSKTIDLRRAVSIWIKMNFTKVNLRMDPKKAMVSLQIQSISTLATSRTIFMKGKDNL